jgi:sialic acid synthase SpsE
MGTVRFQIGSRWVGEGAPLFLIAEAGVNHENSLETARRMIAAAAAAGADAIKFQSYKAARLASRYSPAYWDREKEPAASQHELFRQHDHFEVETYQALARYAAEKKIIFLTTAFDEFFVDALEAVLPAFKVASADITHFPLLKKIATTGKPVILSVGAATREEIEEAVRFLRTHGCRDLALLHCVLNYPCPPERANLRAIASLKGTFPDAVVGYSDHVPPQPGLLQLQAAWMLGARIIEKHFTLDKTIPGNDHYHAMDPQDLRAFRVEQSILESLLGEGSLGPSPAEEDSRKYARRSLVAGRKILTGETVREGDVAVKRPGNGISPNQLESLLGARPLRDIEEDTVLQWNMFLQR